MVAGTRTRRSRGASASGSSCASWQYAGRTAELTAPGSYVATQVGGLPVVLTRDRDDTLRAFANVCRHRGAIVARGAGERGTLQCPYHAWTYGLDGCLRGAPRTKDDPGFATDGLGLVPMAAGTWGPFVFVNPDADAAPLAEALGDLPEVVRRARARRRRARLPPPRRVRDPRELEDRARELPRVLPLPAQPPGARLADRRPPADARGGRAAREPVQPGPPGPRRCRRGRSRSGQFHLLFPSLKFNAQPGPPNLSIGPVWPVAPDRCRGYLDYFFAPDVVRGVDRGVPRLRRPGRGGGHGARRGRAGGRGQRARARGAAARARRAAHRALPALGARAPRLSGGGRVR